VLQGGVGSQDRVVGLDDGGGNLRGGVDSELELGLLAIVNGETLEKEGTETRAGTTTEGVEDEETLETGTVVGDLADAIEDAVDQLLTNCVMAAGIVVGGVFLAGDQLLGVEQLTVGAGADLVDDGRLQVDHDGTGDVLAGAGLREESIEAAVLGVLAASINGEGTVGLESVLKAIQLPAGVTDLDTGLTNVDGDDFTHVEEIKGRMGC
jgi:hypothetical protein